ncbi:MAG TPA: MerR family transcriptional regulator [Candidatus Eremiobacteraceae bacterium]|nr:MerR family transcriptional regulator [Candidatus Eremiobacteraceae bacterium]
MADHRILGASKLTGLTPDTIRKWERRYGVVDPRRDTRGIRRYSEADIARLRELRSATDLGFPIGEAARLKPKELAELVRVKAPQATVSRPRTRRGHADSFTRAVLGGLQRYDGEQVDRMLAAASHLLTPAEFVFDVMSPLFGEIGEAWRKGAMEIGQEHLFSAIARSVLGNLIRRYAVAQDAPRVLFATPAGEPHEFGILLAAMLAASEGIRVHYLGPNMPSSEIARSAAEVGARIVVIGAARSRSKAGLRRAVATLSAALPDTTELWLGGKAATGVVGRQSGHLQRVPTLREFYDRLRPLRSYSA